MAEQTLLAVCQKFLAHPHAGQDFNGIYTALASGEQFRVIDCGRGVAVQMAPAGARSSKQLVSDLTVANPGSVNTPELEKFAASVPLPSCGDYKCGDTYLHVEVIGELVNVGTYAKCGSKLPSWLGNYGGYADPAGWWSSRPTRVTSMGEAYSGRHPDGANPYDLLLIKERGSWVTYTYGGLRALTNEEAEQLVRSGRLRQVRF